MIMRDSAKTLSRCLDSVRGLVSEIIIVDTGSVDNSVNIARSYGAQVYSDPWQNDFARPRNIGIEKARGQWILIMDPDETISKKDHIKVKTLTQIKKYDAFLLTTFNYGPFSRDPKYKIIPNGKDPTGKFPGYTPSTKTRFFRNGLGIKFEGCWHELVDWYIIRHKLLMAKSPVPVHHWNHEIAQVSMLHKRQFYLRMGEKKVGQWPRSGKAHWELAVAEMAHKYFYRAHNSILKAIQYGFDGKDQFFALARCYRELGNKPLADFSFEKATCHLFPSLTHIDPQKKTLSRLTAQP